MIRCGLNRRATLAIFELYQRVTKQQNYKSSAFLINAEFFVVKHFNYDFGGRSYPCTYKVRFDNLIVAVSFGTITVPLNGNDDPLRIARVVAHDILSKADREGLL